MTHFNTGHMSRSELDVYIRAAESPNYRPLPEYPAMSGRLDLPPTAAETEAYAQRMAARAALRSAADQPGARSSSPIRRPVQALRQALLERKRGRGAPEEGVGVGAA